jgi:hypothetical protein
MAEKYSNDKEVRRVLSQLEDQGWRIRVGTKHIQCYSPDGVSIVSMSKTPGAYTAMKNWKAELRRKGAVIK